MHWLPPWLGERYAILYYSFIKHPFTSDEAGKVLHLKASTLRVILSKLIDYGYITTAGRKGRRKQYQVIDPTNALLAYAASKMPLDGVSEPYKSLIKKYLVRLFQVYGKEVVSVVLYGSVARGETHKTSDVDLLLIFDGKLDPWRSRMACRVEDEELERNIYKLWKKSGIYPTFQTVILSRGEAKHHHPLYIDLVHEGRILYDRDGFIAKVFEEIRERLRQLDAQRIELKEGGYYWILKKEVKTGEVIEI